MPTPDRQPQWTTPAEILTRLRKRWNRGDFLRVALEPSVSLFPLRIPLKAPTPREIAEDFSSAQDWIAEWQKQEVRLEWRSANHRIFGQNEIPQAIVVDGIDPLVRLLGVRTDWRLFQNLADETRRRLPALLPWLARRPVRVLELAPDWERLVGIVEWLKANPRPGIYLRQMTVPGVHTKFVESHRKTLAEWLDLVLPPESIDPSAEGAPGFNRRYGFLDKPERIRIRFLDPSKAIDPERLGLDLTLDAAAFSRLAPDVRRVFITENEINFLAFPDIPDSLLLFGGGYGWSTLANADWLRSVRIFYWGDIDTHGFAILDQLRIHFPHTESFLMDRATLETFRDLWGNEPNPLRRDLPRLSATETDLYNSLRENRLAPNLRLEQERISFSWLLENLTARD